MINSINSIKVKKNYEFDTEDGNSIDDLTEYLEHLSRTTPTMMPEWMN